MIFGSTFRIVRSRALSLCCAVALTLSALPASAQSVRIKDIADFEGIRDNMLVGYGIVAGLAGTGDDLSKVIFTRESLLGMLERLGVNARTTNANGTATNELRTKNIATVMVTATLPPFARQGTRLDVQVSAMGDAQSLLGGVLLVTPMMGADGEVYAVAQGPMAISGFRAQGQASTLQRGVPTSGRISNGAIVEREVGFEMASLENVRLTLRNPDLTTARRVAQAVNSFVGAGAARPADPSTINIQVPAQYKGDVVAMLTDIERLPIEPDKVAKVVIDERSGVIVMGENVRISTVAVAQANLTIRVTETPQVSQPGAFAPGATGFPGQANADQVINVPQPRVGADGRPVLDAAGNPIFDMVPQVVPGSRQGGALGGGAQTVVVPRTSIEVDDQSGRRLAMVPSGVTLGELVNGLNALGVGPRDLITILQAIKAAGALQADIEIM